MGSSQRIGNEHGFSAWNYKKPMGRNKSLAASSLYVISVGDYVTIPIRAEKTGK
jgi:hypothetical protein